MTGTLRLGSRTVSKATLKGRLIGRLKAVSMLSASESQFAKIIQELESDPLFQKLFLPGSKLPRVISRLPWPKTRLHQNFYEMKDQSAANQTDTPLESILESRQALLPLIRKIGQEAFERYFLYGTEISSFEEIAAKTGLTLEEVKKIHNLILEISVHSSFTNPRSSLAAMGRRYTLIAKIQPDADSEGRYFLNLTLPHLARGRYRVNREALMQWIQQKVLTREEKKRLKKILESIELANIRQNTLMKILEILCEKQLSYIATSDKTKRHPLTMRMLARELNCAASTISRLVAFRSVGTPEMGEIRLSELLPNRHDVLKSLLEHLITHPQKMRFPDRVLAQKIKEEFHLDVSRRTVNECRRHLEQTHAHT